MGMYAYTMLSYVDPSSHIRLCTYEDLCHVKWYKENIALQIDTWSVTQSSRVLFSHSFRKVVLWFSFRMALFVFLYLVCSALILFHLLTPLKSGWSCPQRQGRSMLKCQSRSQLTSTPTLSQELVLVFNLSFLQVGEVKYLQKRGSTYSFVVWSLWQISEQSGLQ